MGNIYLCKPDRTFICAINNIDPTTVNFTKNLTDLWELTFAVKRYDEKQNQTDFYEAITGGMWIYLDTEKDKGYFIIDTDPEIEIDGITETKMVTCHSCECEMQKKFLKKFKVNTGELNLSLEYLVKDEDGNFVNINPYTQLPYRYVTLVDYGNEIWTDTITGDGTTRTFYLSFPYVDNNLQKPITIVGYEDNYKTDPLIPSITFDTAPNADTTITITYYRTLYGEVCKQLSLLDLIIEKAELTGWTIDPNISEKLQEEYYTFDVDDQDIYSFLTQQLAATARVLVTFDRVNMIIGLVDEEEIGKDTGAFLSYRNLLNNLKKTPANDTGIITKYYPFGQNNLGIEYVNFGQDYMLDLDYYAHAKDEYGNFKYMSAEMSQAWDDYLQTIDGDKITYDGEDWTRRELFAEYTRRYNKAYLKRTELYDRLPIDGLVIDYTTYKCYELVTAYKAYMNALESLLKMYKIEHPDDPVDPNDETTWDGIKQSFYWLDYESYVKGIIPKIFEAFKIWCKTKVEDNIEHIVINNPDGVTSVTLSTTPLSIISVSINGDRTTKYKLVGSDVVFDRKIKKDSYIDVKYAISAILIDNNGDEITLQWVDNANPIVTSREEDPETGAVNKVTYNDNTLYYTNLVTFQDGLTVNSDYADSNIVRNIEWYLYEPSLYGLDEMNAKIIAWKGVVDTIYKNGFKYYTENRTYTHSTGSGTTVYELDYKPEKIFSVTVDTTEIAETGYSLNGKTLTLKETPASNVTLTVKYGDKDGEQYNRPENIDSETGWNEHLSPDEREEFANESLFETELNLYLDYVSPYARPNGLVGGTSIGVIPLFENAINDQNTGVKKQIDDYGAEMESYDVLRKALQDAYTYTNYFTEEQREIFNPLISETVYTNENYLVTNLDDIVTTVDEEEELYQYAKKELNKVAQPQWHFDISADNLFKLSEYKPVADVVDVGNWVRVQTNLYKDKFVKLRIMSYQYNPLDISPELTLTFSNITYSYNKMSDLDYIFSNMGGTTGSGSTGSTGGSSGTYGENDAEINLSNTMLNALLSSDNYNNMLNNKINLYVGSLTADYIKSRIIEAEEITVGGKIKIDSDGVTVGYGQSGYSYVSDAGLDVYKDNVQVAKFGSTTELISGTQTLTITSNGVDLKDTSNSTDTPLAHFGSYITLGQRQNGQTIGDYSQVFGIDCVASGEYGHAEGSFTTSSGEGSHAEGLNTTASGDYSHVEGKGSIAYGEGSHAEGTSKTGAIYNNIGDYTGDGTKTRFAILKSRYDSKIDTPVVKINDVIISDTNYYFDTSSSGSSYYLCFYTPPSNNDSILLTFKYLVIGNYAHSEGNESCATGEYSHAEGNNTIASGKCSHAEGFVSTASGQYAHSEGHNTTASGGYSHVEGDMSQAIGTYSHAEGYFTIASGNYSHAEGGSTRATGYYSHASGDGTIASQECQTVIGRNNVEDTQNKYVFIIGNGNANVRRNILAVDWNGNIHIPSYASVLQDLDL